MPSIPSENIEYWFIFQNDKLLFIVDGIEHILINRDTMDALKHAFIRQYQLPLHSQTAIYCAELSPDYALPAHFQALPLRKSLEMLTRDWYSIIARAYAIITWDKNHQFCGRCARPTEYHPDIFERKCNHCQLYFYPRISPSVIVLIKKGDHLLMARSPHFPPGVYGLIAGFVEPGESIEEAACREVKEEVGIAIKNLQYFGSQPWPFPDSLMFGFTADYAEGDIVMNRAELEDAGWYRYDQLPGRPSTSISIASTLIDHFIAEQQSSAMKL
jgi:NAD+ diphosphatase